MIKSSDILNISSHSVEHQIGNPVLATQTETGTQRSGGPSTIVVMMNGNSNQIYPSHYDNNQSSIPLENRNIQESPNTSKQFQPRTTSTERYTIDSMPYQEKENTVLQR